VLYVITGINICPMAGFGINSIESFGFYDHKVGSTKESIIVA
jgi:hypothetical protein